MACVLFGLAVGLYRWTSTSLGAAAVASHLKKSIHTIGFIEGAVQLQNGTYWYLERPSQGQEDGPPLIVLPGATLDMAVIGADLRKLCREFSNRRMVVLENLFHGRQKATSLAPLTNAPSFKDMAEHLERMRTALGITEAFDLLGYSLGGSIAAQYVAARPDRVNRLLLLAPYFYETACDSFQARFDALDWRSIHGWETFDEMTHFFQHWLGLQPSDHPPKFILKGIHKLRTKQYPKGYWSTYFDSVYEVNLVHNRFLTDRAADLFAYDNPTLVIAASEDTVCDAKKLESLNGTFNPDKCTVIAVHCGHYFGPNRATLMTLAHSTMVEFLSI